MEINGKVIKILDVMTFTSKKEGKEGVEYKKYTFVLETQGQYPKHVAMTVMGEDRFNALGIVVGGIYNIYFDLDAREWNGKWFNEISAWKAVRTDAPQYDASSTNTTEAKQAPQEEKPQEPQPKSEEKSDVPF